MNFEPLDLKTLITSFRMRLFATCRVMEPTPLLALFCKAHRPCQGQPTISPLRFNVKQEVERMLLSDELDTRRYVGLVSHPRTPELL